jgi:hypothetical protein
MCPVDLLTLTACLVIILACRQEDQGQGEAIFQGHQICLTLPPCRLWLLPTLALFGTEFLPCRFLWKQEPCPRLERGAQDLKGQVTEHLPPLGLSVSLYFYYGKMYIA